jgi:hypothetical protein
MRGYARALRDEWLKAIAASPQIYLSFTLRVRPGAAQETREMDIYALRLFAV